MKKRSFPRHASETLPTLNATTATTTEHVTNNDNDSSQPRDSGSFELKPSSAPFAGRIGGNQLLTIDPTDSRNEEVLKTIPDALPYISLQDALDLKPFLHLQLWKLAAIECIGTMLVVFTTTWPALRPSLVPTFPETASGVYGTSAFFGPLIGGIANWILLTQFIYAFSGVSGGQLNPTITMATFFARLVSLPRLVLYVIAQIIGGTLAGLALRAAFGSGDFVAGGCHVDTDLVPVRDAFVLEFMYTLALIVICFGVALDPRQANIIGTTLAPALVGLALGILSFTSAFVRPGYNGASMNPARCFGVFVGSSFPGYHWIHWVGPLAAAVGHGVMYYLVPPWVAMLDH